MGWGVSYAFTIELDDKTCFYIYVMHGILVKDKLIEPQNYDSCMNTNTRKYVTKCYKSIT